MTQSIIRFRTKSAGRVGQLASLYSSSVGRKWVMALSGIAIIGFVVVHLFGTLKIFLGPEETNHYGEALRALGGDLVPRTHLLWVFRLGLLGAFAVHLHAAFSLDLRNRRANGTTAPSLQVNVASTYASRTVLWSGITVGLFVVFHVLDLTIGVTNSEFEHGDAYGNQIASFENPLIVAVYLAGVAALTVHLFHGFWSLTQSLGVVHPLLTEQRRRRFATVAASAIGLGYASIPIAVIVDALPR